LATVTVAAVTVVAIALSCSKPPAASEPRVPREVDVPAYLKDTVSEMAAVVGNEDVPVEGIGFVTNLDGTGTRTIPPGVRAIILDVMKRNKVEHPEQFVGDPDNAVVRVTGLMPPGINKGEHFDLEVRAIPNTDTTSLEGGFLLECDMTRVVSMRGMEAKSENLSLGRGSIFVTPFVAAPAGKDSRPIVDARDLPDTKDAAKGTDSAGSKDIKDLKDFNKGAKDSRDTKDAPKDASKVGGDPRVGRILGGGKALKARTFQLSLYNPSVRTADQIVRMVNTRFNGAAKGTRDPDRVDLEVPREFQDDKAHFLDLVGGLYLREGASVRDMRVEELLKVLKTGETSEDMERMDRVAICLESFGPSVSPRLHTLCDDPKEIVRFYVGRTLANLQDGRAVSVLDPIVMDDKSPFQEAAAAALGKLPAGLGVLTRALNVKSARVRVAAWQALQQLAPRMTLVRRFADKFSLSVVATRGDPFIYVSRTMRPQIAIFGDAKILPPVFAETPRVTASVTTSAGKPAETIRLIAQRHGQDIYVESKLDVRDLIVKLATPYEPKQDPDALLLDPPGPPQGLDLGYSDVVGLLNELSRKKALTVPIMLQPLKYYITGDRPVIKPIETSEAKTPA
jgi:flagellar basal body P-ring protein FlgI